MKSPGFNSRKPSHPTPTHTHTQTKPLVNSPDFHPYKIFTLIISLNLYAKGKELVFKNKNSKSQTQIQKDTQIHLWPQHLGNKQEDQEPKVILGYIGSS